MVDLPKIELCAKSACDGLLPHRFGPFVLSEVAPAHITAILPFAGQEKSASKALKAAHGMGFPAPNRATGKAGARAVWAGQGQALLLGPAPDAALAEYAALVDQSDAWAALRLEGAGAGAVLARLTPLDLRAHLFKRGHSARANLHHMMASFTRTGVRSFDILVFRSMAPTAVADISRAMQSVAAQSPEQPPRDT